MDITYEQKEDIRRAFLASSPKPADIKRTKQALAEQYGTTVRDITSIVDANPNTNTEIEKKYFEIPIAKEQEKLHKAKMNLLDLLLNAISDADQAENRHLLIDNFVRIYDRLDATHRLNDGEATARIETTTNTTNTAVDIAEILKQLKTPEEKKAFLLSGMRDQRKDKI